MDSMYYFAESLMKVGLPFILENNFENTSKADLQKLIEVYKYQTITERGMRNFVIGDNLIKVDCTDYNKLDYKVVNKKFKTIIQNINSKREEI